VSRGKLKKILGDEKNAEGKLSALFAATVSSVWL
jgi:hypothetical protein